jgi:hypothetical protein
VYILLGLLAGLLGLVCRWAVTSLHDNASNTESLFNMQPVNDDGNMFIVVSYGGPAREFAARLELLSGSNQVQHGRAVVNFENYAAYWERSQGPRTRLGRGEKDRIVIGRVEPGPTDLPPSTVFRMAFWDEFNQRKDEYASTGWLNEEPQIDPARLELRVTVSATTPGPGTTYTNTFVVNGADPKALRDEKIFTTNYTGPTVRHF